MSIKTAMTDDPILDLIKERWSPRAFSHLPVEPEKLRSLFEAARWAASAGNEQPWHFIIAARDNSEEFLRILHCLNESNQVWAKSAAVLGIAVAKMTFGISNKPYRHAFHDLGQAWANLAIQATALGLHVHPMAGFNVEKARTELGVPEGYEPVTAFAIGYLGDPGLLPEEGNLRQRETTPRTRKSIREFVFSGRWGESSPLIKE